MPTKCCWLLLLTLVLPACGDDARLTAAPPAEALSRSPQEATLAALLSNPPRLPRTLRDLAARALAERWAAELDAADLAAEIDRARARGELASVEELAAWRSEMTRETERTADLEASDAARRMATRSLLLLARRELATHRREQAGLGLALVLHAHVGWEVDPATGRPKDLKAAGKSIEALLRGLTQGSDGLLTTESRMATYREARRAYDRLRSTYARSEKGMSLEQRRAQTRAITAARARVNVAKAALPITWREHLATAEVDWDAHSASWSDWSHETALGRVLGSEPISQESLRTTSLWLSKGETPAAPRLAESSKRSARLVRAISVYEDRLADGGGVEHAGLAMALRLGMRGLDAVDQRIRAITLRGALRAQALSAIKPTMTWRELATQLGARPAFDGDAWSDGAADLPIQASGLLALRRSLDTPSEDSAATLDALRATRGRVQTRLATVAGTIRRVSTAFGEVAAEDLHDVEGILASDDHEKTREVRMTMAHELLHGDGNVRTRIDDIERGASLYSPFSSEARHDLLTRLRRHDRRDDEPVDEQTEKKLASSEKRQQRIAAAISHGEEAVGAARDVTEMLVTLELIPVEDANKVLRGLDAANAGLTIAAGLATGNVFDVISGTANLISILSGKPAPPDPAQVRHEQVMEALGELAEGQMRILEGLAAVMEQIDGIRMQLGELERIMISTHQLVVDDQLQGLRFARDFIDRLDYYSDDDAYGMPLDRLADYEQLRAHFEKHRDAYVQGRRFLADHVRGRPLEIQRLAESFKERGDMPRLLGDLGGWESVKQNEERIKQTFRLLDTALAPDVRERVFGSLTEPVQDHTALLRKLEILADPEHARSQAWVQRNRELALETNLKAYENPIIASDIARGIAIFHAYHLIDQGENFSGALPTLEQLTQPGFDPSQGFGSTPESRREQLLDGLGQARNLLSRVRAQGALAQGDVLAPILALLTLSDAWRCDHPIREAAVALVAAEPVLRHNAARFWLMLHRDTSEVQRQRIIERVLGLLAPQVRELCWQGPRYVRPNSMTYEQLVTQPLAALPGGTLLLARRFTDPTVSLSHVLGLLRRQGDPLAKAPLYAYDLRLLPPIEADGEDSFVARQAPLTLGSPAQAYWWNTVRLEEAKTHMAANKKILDKMRRTHDGPERKRLKAQLRPVVIWADPVRLPSAADADAGRYVTLETMDLLDEADGWVESSHAETAVLYPAEQVLDARLLRALWVESLQAAWSR